MLFFPKKPQIVEYTPRISSSFLKELINFARDNEACESPEIDKCIRTVDEAHRILSRHIFDIEYFGEWVGRPRPKRYSRKSIIVDKHMLYVPYHFDASNYGIFFRVRNLWEDFRRFVNFVYSLLSVPRMLRIVAEESEAYMFKLRRLRRNPRSLVCSVFVEYIVFHYAHAVAHHVFEDMALIFEKMGRGKYSLVKSADEEMFCHYIAFTTLEKYMPGVLARSKKAERLISIFYPLIPEFRWDFVESINFATTKLLYVYYVVLEGDDIKPGVSLEIKDRLGFLFRILWKFHYTYEEDIVEFGSRPLVQRIYLTTY